MMSLTFGLFNQVSGLGPLGPLVAERRGLAFVYSLPGTLFSKTLSFRLHRLPHYTFKVLPCQ